MRKEMTVISREARLVAAKTRLVSLCGGDEALPSARSAKLAILRDGDTNPDIASRLEVAYLVKLAETLHRPGRSHIYVETVIAGRPDADKRRVFARITDIPEQDGTTFDLYTKTRDTRFEPVATMTPIKTPAKRIRKAVAVPQEQS